MQGASPSDDVKEPRSSRGEPRSTIALDKGGSYAEAVFSAHLLSVPREGKEKEKNEVCPAAGPTACAKEKEK